MSSFEQDTMEENDYLVKVVSFIKDTIDKENTSLSTRRETLISSRKEMWEDTAHSTKDFEKLTEVSQHLSVVAIQTASYDSTLKQVKKYKNTLSSPYFGRFDFKEDGSEYNEKIYIGMHNIMDSKTYDVLVYDWRAPISSIFYRFEPGRASYRAPKENITGEVLLKRQYKIHNSKLKYFFDCSVRITDEVLQEVLSRNSSVKMRNIVETIQKEQDIIIRDTQNELLIVQGVAGSGKTSIALHRIAFLLYEGMNLNLSSNNIIIISPNYIFSKYISSVLPELGEDNVEQSTLDDITDTLFNGRFRAEHRNSQLESLILHQGNCDNTLRRENIEFKGSNSFIEIIDRLLDYYERHMIDFQDIYFDGKVIESRHQLKNIFLNNKIGIPAAKRLKRIERMVLDKIHPLQRQGLEKIEKIVQKSDGHEFEIKSFSRLLSIKRTKAFIDQMHRFTEIDYFNLYKLLFNKKDLFYRLTQGLVLPNNIDQIISSTKEKLQSSYIPYEDCAPLLYLKLKIEGSNLFSDIRQVVIDEGQDYYPMQYNLFKLLFRDARYTILGDINQAVEKSVDRTIYDNIEEILCKNKSVKLYLNKSYRSSYEINAYTGKLLNKEIDLISFDRHEEQPSVIFMENEEKLDIAIVQDIKNYFSKGYESIAVICKTQEQSEKVYYNLKNLLDIRLVTASNGEIEKGTHIIPSYLSKGLEFDAVIVYDASKENYESEFDRNLLYIACTRALHQLTIYYIKDKSRFI